MGKVYKVYCEYYVKAKNREEAEKFVQDEFAYADFHERHIIIDETSNIPDNEIFEDLTKE